MSVTGSACVMIGQTGRAWMKLSPRSGALNAGLSKRKSPALGRDVDRLTQLVLDLRAGDPGGGKLLLPSPSRSSLLALVGGDDLRVVRFQVRKPTGEMLFSQRRYCTTGGSSRP